MKRRMLIGIAGTLALILGVSVGGSFAQEQKEGKATASRAEPAKSDEINAYMAKRIIGSKVFNMKGENLGTIQDMVIDIDTGRILYAVMDFGGFLGIGGKLFPVPWQSLAPLPSEGIFFLDISRAKLKEAPFYSQDTLPDMGDMHWGTKITQFYEGSPRERSYNYGYGNGFGFYPGIAKQDPFEKVFDPQSIKEISGEVIKVDQVVPEVGLMSQVEVKLIVLVNRKTPVPVFLGPLWYVAMRDGRIPFKSGDKISVTGSWITSQTGPFMVAVTVTEASRTFRLRQKDGTPIWSGWEASRQK